MPTRWSPIEPYSWGTNTAEWDWQAYSVVVTDPDGNTNELKLRRPKTRPVAREGGGIIQGTLGGPWGEGSSKAGNAAAAEAAEEAAAAGSSAGSARALPDFDPRSQR